MYYVTDWQGNNVAVVSNTGLVAQRTIYYPYGEPTIEPTGQRYLFGGKEREHAGGRNSYDFGARCLTPYGRWGVVDSESESFYPFSPYTYCAGDPVNYIDPDGKWTVYLSSDKTLNNYARHLHQDGEIHVVAHGNPYYILYDKRDPDHPVGITRGIRLKKVIQHNLFDSQRIINRPGIKIVLHSCNTGTTPNDKEKPLGQELSREIPNAIIIAPNGLLKIDSKGRQSVEDENGKERSKDDSWRVFFRGLEFPIRYIQIIKEYLLTQEQLKSNNTNVENDMKNETDERETRK